LLVCDPTQSYSPRGGGGIGVYMPEKRRYVLEQTGYCLLQIVPGVECRDDWSATFEHLFGAIHPAALAMARVRVARGPVWTPVTRLLRGTA